MTDRITKQQRSALMSRIRSKNTGIEKKIRSLLHKKGLRFKIHGKSLPGKPDIVFSKKKIVVFIDGDFWHGYKYDNLKSKLSVFWRNKIEENIKRDNKNFRKLKKNGWVVIRIWEHQIEKNPYIQMDRIYKVVK